MNQICRDIFQAIHEGKWLSIEYKNQSERITKYWIGIKDIYVGSRSLKVEGLHLGQYTNMTLDCIFIDSIQSSHIVEGTSFPINQKLVQEIYMNPEKYQSLFHHTANLRILNYLEDCNRMDVSPYKTDFELVTYLDEEGIRAGDYTLNQEQFQTIVKHFQYKTKQKKKNPHRPKIQQLAMNVLSIHMPRGLYVLAYRRLELDVVNRCLKPSEDITICSEFTIEGSKENVRRYLEADDYELLNDFEENQEKIKDCICESGHGRNCVDDMPYIIGLGMQNILDLHKEYSAIIEMYQNETCPVPIQAFFGDLLKRSYTRATYPLALWDKRVNLDQILAIHNAMKYSVAYTQGPPGTGKTSTIINTIITGFFHEKTVLFSSYNNHPIDGVFEKLSCLECRNGKKIPFPVVRLGNQEKVEEALEYMCALYQDTKPLKIFEKTLDKNKEDRKKRARQLSELLKRYDEMLDLRERADTLEQMQRYENQDATLLPFQVSLHNQAIKIEERISEIGKIEEARALELLEHDEEEFQKYLLYFRKVYKKAG